MGSLMMEILGIRFIPWNTPLREHVQVLAAVSWPLIFLVFGFLSWPLFLYVLFFTRYYWLALIYLFWIYYDRDTRDTGGRQFEFMRRLKLWNYYRDYFPLRLVKTQDLDPSKNYLLCVSPHGLICFGGFGTICTEAVNISETFPGFKFHITTLATNFYLPFIREFLLSIGMCSVSSRSISHLLSYSNGGHITSIVLGGAEETFYSEPGTFKVILKRRKGFIKLALKHGTPIIPAIIFGETDLYDLHVRQNSIFYHMQRKIKEMTGIVPVIPNGRGFLQYSFGLVPRKVPLTAVIGKPIDVEKTEVPTQEQIDELHAKYLKHFEELFETEKHKYIENCESMHVIFV